MRIEIDDPGYPKRLRSLFKPPPILTTSGPLEAREAVMIAGARAACEESLDFAFALAYHLARAGIVVISGGALGVDYQAHRGALAASGATWVVSPTGKNIVMPPSHRAFFAEIAASTTSRMIWPFRDDERERYLYRNSVAVALADAVVIVEARLQSGSRNAARWARQMGRPLFVVPGPPWSFAFSGSLAEIEKGGRILTSIPTLFAALELPAPKLDDPRARRRPDPTGDPNEDTPAPEATEPLPPPELHRSGKKKEQPRQRPNASIEAVDQDGWSEEEKHVYSVVSHGPTHRELIVQKSGLSVSSAVTALLTLSLKDVVVEGPDGFFRRKNAM